MTPDHHARGGAAVAALDRLDIWEACIVQNLRLWCEGPEGQDRVWRRFLDALPHRLAQREMHAFDVLLRTIIAHAHRPMVRHEVACAVVGSDEAILLHLIKTAADGHLTDAALIATLLVGPAHAEHVAILAGQVGESARRLSPNAPHFSPEVASNVVRLH